MIAVVADDLTGAAELGGIGRRYGLSVHVVTAVPGVAPAVDLLVVATDTRSGSRADATALTEDVMGKLANFQPTLIFKKIDSALRGHVLPELLAQLKVLNQAKGLLVPANPDLGRTIADGVYYLQGTPIHETSFAQDPEFPVRSSRVLEMVQAETLPVQVLPAGAPQPASGIVIGEARSAADLRTWAKRLEPGTAVAGAAGFFTALLEARGFRLQPEELAPEPVWGKPVLFVCGSTFARSRALVRALQDKGGPVSYMPRELAGHTGPGAPPVDAWAAEVLQLLQSRGRAVMAIDPATTAGSETSAAALREQTARAVRQVFASGPIGELLVEGGATAAAILDRLELKTFTPVRELAPGVIRMQVSCLPDLCLTLKPGSYEWPPAIWNSIN